MGFVYPKLFAVAALLFLWMGDLEAANEKIKAKHGNATLREKNSNTIRVQLQQEDENTEVRLSKIKMQYTNSPPSLEGATTELFVSDDGNVTCSETCIDKACNMQCMQERSDSVSYLDADSALVISSGEYEEFVFSHHQNGGNRKRSDVTTNILTKPNQWTDVGVIKILVSLDAGFMNVFLGLSDGNFTEAYFKAETFVTLMCNKVNLYYTTLQQYNRVYNSTDGMSYRLILYTYLYDIEFPPMGIGAFIDRQHIQDNLVDGRLRTILIFDSSFNYLGFSGSLEDTAVYVRQFYGPEPNFNLVTFLSGYGILFEYVILLSDGTYEVIGRATNVIGVTFLNVACVSYADLPFSFQFSFNTLFAPTVAKIIAHEIGHNVGANHDEFVDCPPDAYTVMAPSLTYSLRSFDQFYHFSSCSADFIANYLSSFSSSELAQCLFTEHPTEEEFLYNLCQGLNGYEFSINDTCEIFFGSHSYVCNNGSEDLFAGYLPNHGCATDFGDNDIPPVLLCADVDGCEGSSNRLYDAFDGTKCLNPGGIQGKWVCFKGECKSQINLCDNRQKKRRGNAKRKRSLPSEPIQRVYNHPIH